MAGERRTDYEVIVGGCRDGFWSRTNCDNAARLGLCSLTTIVDQRPPPESPAVPSSKEPTDQ